MSKKRFNVSQAKEVPGRDKPIWLRHGVAFQNEDGRIRVKLESLPLPNHENEIWLTLFDDDGQQKQQGYPDAPVVDTPDDDIPF